MGWISHLCLMNMKRRKTRTFLTILGVVIGVISVVTLLAVGIGVRQEMINSMVDSESICRIQVTGATGGKHKDRMIMDQTVKTFQELEYVSSVYPTYEMYVTITNGKYSYDGAITGIPQSELAKLKYTKTSKQTTSSVKPVLIMENKVTSLFYNPETEQTYDVTEKKKAETWIGKKVDLSFWDSQEMTPVKIEVGAVIDSGEDTYNRDSQSIYCDLDVLKSFLGRVSSGGTLPGQPLDANGNPYKDFVYSGAVVTVDNIDHVDSIVKKLQDMGYTTENEKEYLDTIQKYLKMVQLLLGGIGAIALIVAVIGISNTMTTSVFDRINEIGVLKVLGCDPDELQLLFLTEAGIIGAAGGIIGVLLSYGFKGIVDKIAIKMFDLAKGTQIAIIPWELAAGAVVGAILLAICAGYFPARFASKLQPLDAVRNR